MIKKLLKKGISPADTDEAHCKSDHECVREFKSDDRPDLYTGTLPLDALKAIISIEAKHKETFSIMHIDMSRAFVHAKAQISVLIRLLVEDRMGTDDGKVGLMKITMYGMRPAIGKST